MSDQLVIKLEENLYEDYKGDLEMKYFGGINSIGEPWFSKTEKEIEEEATKQVKEFMDRNS